jgi:hypothetical protein
VIQTSPGLCSTTRNITTIIRAEHNELTSDGSGVRQHADGTLNFSQITTWHNRGWLVVDTDFEASWTPVDELNGSFRLDGGDGSVDILGDDITTVQQAAGHVFA